jgi:hypothetical protein
MAVSLKSRYDGFAGDPAQQAYMAKLFSKSAPATFEEAESALEKGPDAICQLLERTDV